MEWAITVLLTALTIALFWLCEFGKRLLREVTWVSKTCLNCVHWDPADDSKNKGWGMCWRVIPVSYRKRKPEDMMVYHLTKGSRVFFETHKSFGCMCWENKE